MLGAILAGSAISLIGGGLLLLTKASRSRAIHLTLPFGAGALLAAAFFDLLPESFKAGAPRDMLVWALFGFILFFIAERLASWFHHHHDHETEAEHIGTHQGNLVMIGDLLHNMIDGVAIAASFLVNPATGFITTLAVSAHEIPKELGTFGILLSRGWRDKKVVWANIATALGTIVAATLTYVGNSAFPIPESQLLAITSGIFIYIAASDIIPDIHGQPRRLGTIQAAVLVVGLVLVAVVIRLLGV